MNEKEARAAITVQKDRGYTNRWTGEWIPPVWELRTPDGWCWEEDRHLNCCFTAKEATHERLHEPIQRCTEDCMVCGKDSGNDD